MRRKRRQKITWLPCIVGFVFICLLSYASYHYEEIEQTLENQTQNQTSISSNTQSASMVEGNLQMHTIDVGQGDSILLCEGENTMLIDCGTKANGEKVVEYLKKLGIPKIDVLVGTHPHDDHMGGMAEVIKNFEIGTLYALDCTEDGITTIWYQEFLDAVLTKNINWVFPKAGDEISIGK